jgi:hypothetical protein
MIIVIERSGNLLYLGSSLIPKFHAQIRDKTNQTKEVKLHGLINVFLQESLHCNLRNNFCRSQFLCVKSLSTWTRTHLVFVTIRSALQFEE